ncbi:RNA polymerase sigma factor [Georgenia alba]|uniref:RNA polymerase sigma factor n=1 Tax=Georgenia alba TaxID=2233858 RepID=A0ABW2Q2C9_9MICO
MTTELEDVWRRETPHVLGALVRRYGDFDGAEDAVQEALFAAARQWPTEGVPDNPRGWLIRVASRRLVDHLRSESARAAREEAVGVARPDDAELAPAADAPLTEGDPAGDDTLRLLLLCCHPALTPPSQVALTLRSVVGLTTAQVAAVFLVPESTMAQRISRAKATLRRAGARFELPAPGDLPDRLAAVLEVLYLLFTEGHTASGGPQLVDVALTREAIRLTRQLRTLVPEDDEVAGALALMLLTDARSATRTDEHGDLVPLEEQDRSRWDRAAIEEGVRLVEEVLPHGRVGAFQLQAAIAAVHAEAPTAAETDWLQITVLYRMLEEVAPGPAVTLNRAVAVGMAHGPEAGLGVVDPLTTDASMRRHHRTWAVRAHLLEMAGRPAEAAADFARAASLTTSIPEQRYLNRRAARAHSVRP